MIGSRKPRNRDVERRGSYRSAGDLLRAAREAHNWSQEEAAAQCNIAQRRWGWYETGEKRPRMDPEGSDVVRRIVDRAGVDATELMKRWGFLPEWYAPRAAGVPAVPVPPEVEPIVRRMALRNWSLALWQHLEMMGANLEDKL